MFPLIFTDNEMMSPVVFMCSFLQSIFKDKLKHVTLFGTENIFVFFLRPWKRIQLLSDDDLIWELTIASTAFL